MSVVVCVCREYPVCARVGGSGGSSIVVGGSPYPSQVARSSDHPTSFGRDGDAVREGAPSKTAKKIEKQKNLKLGARTVSQWY